MNVTGTVQLVEGEVKPLAELIVEEDVKIAEQAEIMDLIDKCGSLDLKIKKFNESIVAEFALAKARLQELIAKDLKQDATATKKGEKFVVKIGACGKSRTLTNLALAASLLGDEVFMQVVSVPMKALDDYLTPEQRAKVLTEGRTATRSFSLAPLK